MICAASAGRRRSPDTGDTRKYRRGLSVNSGGCWLRGSPCSTSRSLPRCAGGMRGATLRAAIGHVHHAYTGQLHEQLAVEMLRRAGAGRGHVDLAGLALAYAMNSLTVVTGTDGFTTSTPTPRTVLAMGTMSRRKSNLRLS